MNILVVQSYFPGYVPDAEKFGDRIRIIGPEKWFIRKFVPFQYGTLNPDSRPHASVLERLKKEGVSKGLVKGLHTIKDKDKDKVKDKVNVFTDRTSGKTRFAPPTADQVSVYARELGFDLDGSRFTDYYASKGWKVGNAPMKDWKAAVRTWKKNAFDKEGIAGIPQVVV